MVYKKLLSAAVLLALAACTTEVQTNPTRSAMEELLLSSASDRAAAKLALQIPGNAKVFVDSTYFEGTDSKYAIASIRSHLLQRGLRLVDDRKVADTIIETRAGALSVDRRTYLIGLPGFNIPIPLTSGTLPFPEIALYGKEEQNGVAKFAITAFSAKDGLLIAAQEPQLGFAHNTKKTILLFFSTSQKDYLPVGVDEGDVDKTDPSQKRAAELGINGDGYAPVVGSATVQTSGSTSGSSSASGSGSGSAIPFKLPGL